MAMAANRKWAFQTPTSEDWMLAHVGTKHECLHGALIYPTFRSYRPVHDFSFQSHATAAMASVMRSINRVTSALVSAVDASAW